MFPESFTEVVQTSVVHNPHRGTLRGLHYQFGEFAESKIVTCLSGAILDIVVDLRAESSSHGEHCVIELSSSVRNSIVIPKGFAHGYLTLTRDCVVMYSTDASYSPNHSGGIHWKSVLTENGWGGEKIMSSRDAGLPILNREDLPRLG